MPAIKGEVAGRVLTLLGYDGTDFYNVLVDAAGRLQIDVVGSGLPLGAATEATLATLATEAKLQSCFLMLTSIDGFVDATWARLGLILTELGLKADLTETQPVSVAVLPLPTGAATQATLATLATEAKLELVRLLLVSLDTELALHAKQTETQPVSAASLPLPTGAASAAGQASLLSELQTKADLTDTQPVSVAGALTHYLGQIMQRNFTANAAAGVNLLTGAGPAAGEVWVITGMSAYNDNNAVTGIFMGAFNGANYHWVNSCGAAGADVMLSWSGEIVLVNGDTPRCYLLGCTLNDDIYFFVYGYKREL